MIIFQITLTGPMLVYLATAQRQLDTGEDMFDILRWDGRFVSTIQQLERQGLLTHETPISGP